MTNEISNAFSILLVGMLTVFFILGLVVLIGNLIIVMVNKFSNEKVDAKQQDKNKIAEQQAMAAIIATVDVVTQGNGIITNVKHIKE